MNALRTTALLALLGLAPATARADCEVTGVTSLDRLRVRVAGQPLRTLAVTNLPVAVRPGRGGRYRDVRVLAPIIFGARTDDDVPWTVPRPGAVADGMLWLTPEVEIERVRERVSGDELVVRAQLDAGVWVERVHVPCDAIAVGHGEGRAEPDWPAPRGPRWRLHHDHLWLVARPDDGEAASVRLHAPRGLNEPLTEIERRGSWVRVMSHFGSGAVVRGWVRSHHLRAPGPPHPTRRYVRGVEQRPSPLCRRRDPRPDEYVGPAHITVGAHVHMGRDGPVWATVSEPAVFTVSVRGDSPWVRVVHVPGLSGDGRCPQIVRRAWVRRSMVTLSGEGGRYDPMELLGLE